MTVALSKGKLLAPTLAVFRKAGYDVDEISEDSRRMVFHCPKADTTVLIVRPSDVPTYVEYGAADA
ncbi:MAG TPA: ATP phosphoribosyltransferase, partial [Nitrospirales bacterium]|nr:ATP phosphoribosyltransferase [Nitrospirales bacterium]